MKLAKIIFGLVRHIASIFLIIAAVVDLITGNYDRATVLMIMMVMNALMDIDDSINKAK